MNIECLRNEAGRAWPIPKVIGQVHNGQTQKYDATSRFRPRKLCKSLKEKCARLLLKKKML